MGHWGMCPPGAWPCTSIWQFLFTYKLISSVISENHAISRFNRRLTDSQSRKLAYMTHNLKIILILIYSLIYATGSTPHQWLSIVNKSDHQVVVFVVKICRFQICRPLVSEWWVCFVLDLNQLAIVLKQTQISVVVSLAVMLARAMYLAICVPILKTVAWIIRKFYWSYNLAIGSRDAPCGLRGYKNRPALFPGRMS